MRAPKKPRVIASGVVFGGLVACYVLDDKRRVLSEDNMAKALGGDKGCTVAELVQRLPKKHHELLKEPAIEFAMDDGGTALGREATWFIELCNVYMDCMFEPKFLERERPTIGRAIAITTECAKAAMKG